VTCSSAVTATPMPSNLIDVTLRWLQKTSPLRAKPMRNNCKQSHTHECSALEGWGHAMTTDGGWARRQEQSVTLRSNKNTLDDL
jgi:hypothetical protein